MKLNEEDILINCEGLNRGIICLRFVIFSMFPYFTFIQITEENKGLWLDILLILFSLIFIQKIYKDMISFYNEGFYITKDSFITYSKTVIDLNDIYFTTERGALDPYGFSISFYNKKKFILNYVINSEEEFDNLLKVLYEISNNNLFTTDPITFDKNIYKTPQWKTTKLI